MRFKVTGIVSFRLAFFEQCRPRVNVQKINQNDLMFSFYPFIIVEQGKMLKLNLPTRFGYTC